jgi:hypothetical protein
VYGTAAWKIFNKTRPLVAENLEGAALVEERRKKKADAL